jgi:hypothetical protein
MKGLQSQQVGPWPKINGNESRMNAFRRSGFIARSVFAGLGPIALSHGEDSDWKICVTSAYI